jgi:hypothetical protein
LICRTLICRMATGAHLLDILFYVYGSDAAADFTGHFGTLLETCLADKLAMAERTRSLLRTVIEAMLAERRAA